MPAHINKIQVDPKFLISQRILAFLMGNGFFMLGNKSKIEDGYNYISAENNFQAFQYIEAFPEAIEFMQGIKEDLEKYGKSLGRLKIDFSWNYLGQNTEREKYIEKLTEIFWQNQSSEFINETINYPELMESPWKIIRLHNSINNIPVSSDFFSSQTNEFILKTSDSLSNWNYNPYLLYIPTANFQWSININGADILSGVIYSKDEILIHEYTFAKF